MRSRFFLPTIWAWYLEEGSQGRCHPIRHVRPVLWCERPQEGTPSWNYLLGGLYVGLYGLYLGLWSWEGLRLPSQPFHELPFIPPHEEVYAVLCHVNRH